MAKSAALVAAEENVLALTAKVAALEARIVVATEVYRNQRAQIAELEAQLAARGAQKVIPPAPKAPVLREFTKRDGSRWMAKRVGNRTTYHRVVEEEAVAA